MPAPNSSDIVTWLRSGLLPGHSETVQRLMNMSADLIEQLQSDLTAAHAKIEEARPYVQAAIADSPDDDFTYDMSAWLAVKTAVLSKENTNARP